MAKPARPESWAATIGGITPPVGSLLFVACRIGRIGLTEASRGIWPVVLALVLVTAVLILFPSLTTIVPRLFFARVDRLGGEGKRSVDTPYAWLRLTISLLISTIGSVGMWSAVVVLPAIQADFAVARADASLPYTVSMIFFVAGQILMGRLADRSGVIAPVIIGTVSLTLGYVAASFATSLWQFIAAYGLLIGFLGCSATFGPVIADVSHWFSRRRGLAVAMCSCGSYLAGTVWPPIVQHFTQTAGWRATHLGIGVFCAVTMLPLSLALRRPSPATHGARSSALPTPARLPRFMSPTTLQALLMIAGVACCVAMSMPQVHIVAYSGDLGHGATHGAEMLSMMLGFGIVSRLASGWLSDRIGPLITLLLGSGLQALSLLLYLPFDGLASLYVVSALFGLSQGGIVPSYALIVREYFPPAEAGTRITMVLSATVAGMALGGWMSGAIFDHTRAYQAAFLNGFLWNLLNVGIALWLLRRLSVRRFRVSSNGGSSKPRMKASRE